MHGLIRELLLKKLDNPVLKELSDSALIPYQEKLAFSTDSFVVSPLFFPGADIAKLAVCGTVNDLVMQGARPEYLSLALIVEEGLDYRILARVVDSLSKNARKAGVFFVTGDLKVVEKGSCDKLFINTSGIGRTVYKKDLSVRNICPGDRVILTGNIAQHGLAVLSKRKELDLELGVKSDCAALNRLILPVIAKTSSVKFMRDPTRGGLATTLNEIAEASKSGIIIEERNIPISQKVRAASELLGIDPLYVANEGIAVMIVAAHAAEKVLCLLKRHPLGKNSRIIASVTREPRGRVILKTILGTERIVDMLVSDPLPRIC